MSRKKKPRKPTFFIGLSLVGISVNFAIGYGLSELIFGLVGKPPEILAHVISGILGLCLFATEASLSRWVVDAIALKKNGGNRRSHRLDNHEMLKNTLDALERITRGDFTVLIPIDRRDPYNELAESVNKMARELGSIESLRQDFISNVSHEIQSPLTSISGFASLLKSDELSPELRKHYISVIETECKRLSSLSDNLLKLSALEAGNEAMNFKAYRLDKQLENIALMLEPQWSVKDISVEAELEKITVQGDESLLSQVWVNLLHNAIKFTPIGGSISIVLSGDSSKAVCKISDTGIGIADEDKIHIFERFYKVDKARERSLGGNGLGLSLVKKIVDLHGGGITVKSEPQEGAEFIITLPNTNSH